jgi:hypothetical protein
MTVSVALALFFFTSADPALSFPALVDCVEAQAQAGRTLFSFFGLPGLLRLRVSSSSESSLAMCIGSGDFMIGDAVESGSCLRIICQPLTRSHRHPLLQEEIGRLIFFLVQLDNRGLPFRLFFSFDRHLAPDRSLWGSYGRYAPFDALND